MPWINQKRCAGCAKCVQVCPEDAIEMKDGRPVLHYKQCARFMCCRCREACPTLAIQHGFKRVQ